METKTILTTTIVTEVRKTDDYEIFKVLEGNRQLDLSHVEKLKLGMMEKDIIIPIVCNEKMEIIDGQHRLEARKQLNKEVYYIVQEGLNLKDCQKMNSISSPWKKMDYVNAYAQQGYEDYRILRDFMEQYKFMSLSVCEALLHGTTSTGGGRSGKFKEGGFKVRDLDKAHLIARRMLDFKDYKPFGRTLFNTALIFIISNENYDHKTMLRKLKTGKGDEELRVKTNKEDYIKSLSAVYNYRTSAADKVVFAPEYGF